MIELPDVNVLAALVDKQHDFHKRAMDWFLEARKTGWATCPFIEHSVIRIIGKPTYTSSPFNFAETAAALERGANQIEGNRIQERTRLNNGRPADANPI